MTDRIPCVSVGQRNISNICITLFDNNDMFSIQRVIQGGLLHGSRTEKIANHGSRK